MARYVQLDGNGDYFNIIALDIDPNDWPLPAGHTLVPVAGYTNYPSSPTPPTDEERIDAAFPGTDVARVQFEAFFEISNRVIALEGGTAITRAQLRDWLKAKLP